MLNVRIIGAGMILLAGYLSGICILAPAREHIKLLEEGNYLFSLMDSGIRNRKILLPDLADEISKKADSIWKDFFSELDRALNEYSDTELTVLFGDLLEKCTGEYFSGEERDIYIRFGDVMFSGDPELMRTNTARLSSELSDHIAELKSELKERSKAVRIFCISISLFVVILLI